MTEANTKSTGTFARPQLLPRNFIEPILYLADVLSQIEPRAIARDKRMVDFLADSAGMTTFRHQPWCRNLTMSEAFGKLNDAKAKHAAMLVLTLIMKTDVMERPEARESFTKIRLALGCKPVRVPVALDEHTRLVLGYIAPRKSSQQADKEKNRAFENM